MTRVLIAGSGVAAVETALALHALAGDRLQIDLLAPAAELNERPWSVLTPFGAEAAPRIDLAGLVRELDLVWHRDSLAAVEPGARQVLTRGGERLPYDRLVVATGARSQETVPGAVTFRGPIGAGALEGVLERAIRDPELRLVFAAPAGMTWALPLYELALLSSAFLRERKVTDPDITIVTTEAQPLEVLGADVSEAVGTALERHNIRVVTGVPEAATESALRLRGGGLVSADVVVALGELVGPRIPGLPHNDAGFIPVDLHGRVLGCDDVFAAGDATNFAIKHGGLATRQADAVAEAIAAEEGAIEAAEPFHPVVRAMLLAGEDGPLYIEADLVARHGVVSSDPLWSPLDKVAGRYLSPYVASGAATGATLEVIPQQAR
jgi:sulfide:quinone oxidoreductase